MQTGEQNPPRTRVIERRALQAAEFARDGRDGQASSTRGDFSASAEQHVDGGMVTPPGPSTTVAARLYEACPQSEQGGQCMTGVAEWRSVFTLLTQAPFNNPC